jgi:hypothetical protein
MRYYSDAQSMQKSCLRENTLFLQGYIVHDFHYFCKYAIMQHYTFALICTFKELRTQTASN